MKKFQMNLAKNLRLIGLTILAGAMTLTYSGCKQEGCTDSLANNYDEKADEDDGTCAYDRDAMIGSFTSNATINCGVSGSGTASGTLTIANSSTGVTKITVTFLDVPMTCTVSGSTFTIDSQTIDGYTYTGNGSVNGSAINVTINEFDASIPETCVFTVNGTRQ
jgi:hypothetical protein